jgi:hypothetical protein
MYQSYPQPKRQRTIYRPRRTQSEPGNFSQEYILASETIARLTKLASNLIDKPIRSAALTIAPDRDGFFSFALFLGRMEGNPAICYIEVPGLPAQTIQETPSIRIKGQLWSLEYAARAVGANLIDREVME